MAALSVEDIVLAGLVATYNAVNSAEQSTSAMMSASSCTSRMEAVAQSM